WDELQDVELKIRSVQVGTGLIEDFPVTTADGPPHAGLSFDLDLLVAYMLSLKPPTNPNHLDQTLVQRGAQVFEDQECGSCHTGPAGTDLQSHDVGTGSAAVETRMLYDTPSLRYLWLSAPYFHDGSAATLMDVFMHPGTHELIKTVEPADIDALVAYLLSWSM
ncbi:MAG: c-type cytochrome, partial [Anaerolineae bacterium]|nr:c-type cytochrome [Anaerolineae bacterium]